MRSKPLSSLERVSTGTGDLATSLLSYGYQYGALDPRSLDTRRDYLFSIRTTGQPVY